LTFREKRRDRPLSSPGRVKASLEDTLIDVWRQALVESAEIVELSAGRFAARRTPQRDLRQVDFVFDGNEMRGLEQKPQTRPPWAERARSGQKVMQFLSEGPLCGKCRRREGHHLQEVSQVQTELDAAEYLIRRANRRAFAR
jgi:hypothetical protein